MARVSVSGFPEINKRLFKLYSDIRVSGSSCENKHVVAELIRISRLVKEERTKAAEEAFARYKKLILGCCPEVEAECSRSMTLQLIPDERSPAKRILVNGIGRSGTTLIYQQLAQLLLLADRKVNFRYEPYIWNIRTAKAKGNPFDMSQLHQFGLMVHTTTPLFLYRDDKLHDSFIDHLFNEPWDADAASYPDSYLTKVIRGSGRLRGYLNRYPDLRIVICLRNPLDTINSSLGMFSFFGEEFHSDDRARFRAELEARNEGFGLKGVPALGVEWYGHWWRAFTDEMLAVARDFPENVFSFCYEAFQDAPNETLDALMNFVGIRNLGMFMGLSKPAGPTIKTTNLTRHDLQVLAPQTAYYQDTVLVPHLGKREANARMEEVVSKYLEGRFSFPLAGSDLGKKSPIQLRRMVLHKNNSAFFSLVNRARHPVEIDKILERHKGSLFGERFKIATAESLKCGKRFGVVILCHNNAETVVDAILSCLNQTLPFDEIVVVDDRSTDKSPTLIRELDARYSSLRLVTLTTNVGPAAARNIGFQYLETEFVTQLDGDDLFWPTKNAEEAAAVAGDERTVSFSDVLTVRPGGSVIQDTTAYHGKTGLDVWVKMMARTNQIPRDMTIPRKLLFEAGGYDMTKNLYEDWDFKLRLATCSRVWVRAACKAGTIYNRFSPGLSGVGDDLHARALSQIFLSNSAGAPIPPKDLLAAFDSAVGRFSRDDTVIASRRALKIALAHHGGVHRISALARSRHLSSLDNREFSDELNRVVKEGLQEEVEA